MEPGSEGGGDPSPRSGVGASGEGLGGAGQDASCAPPTRPPVVCARDGSGRPADRGAALPAAACRPIQQRRH